jgi:hypothetical protein
MAKFLGDAVLAMVLHYLPESSRQKLYVEPYVNGREVGHCIRSLTSTRKVSFSEHRIGESIVVYTGIDTDFSPQGNVPRETVESKIYPSPNITTAVDAIINYLFEYN